jgi:hypothetical protein
VGAIVVVVLVIGWLTLGEVVSAAGIIVVYNDEEWNEAVRD